MSVLSQVKKGRDRLPPRLLIYGSEGIGKAQPLDALVLTPKGFVRIDSMQIGSKVIGSDGKPYIVIGVYLQGKREVYRVTLRDGSSTRCCDDHLWFTRTREEYARNQEGSIRSLREIRETLLSGTQFNHDIPHVRPVEFALGDAPLPVDPYELGQYLGDGCKSVLATYVMNDPGTIQVSVQSKRGSQGLPATDKIAACLGSSLILPERRYIPQEYVLASIEERIALLRGLLECDEDIRRCGLIEFGTTSEFLAADLCFLIRSLGGLAMLGDKDGIHTYAGRTFLGDGNYRIHAAFPEGITITSMQTGANPLPDQLRNSICKVESLGEAECVCIRTDAPDSLYVTDDFILTHNSSLSAQAPNVIFIDTEGGLSEIDCQRFPQAKTFAEVMEQLKALRTEEHNYAAVAIDSCDWLERLIWEEVCKEYGVGSIEKAAGGYGKGYVEASNRFHRLLEQLDALRREKGMAVILIAHAKVEPFTDPDVGTYDRYSPRLHKLATAILTEWCDAVLFATRRIAVQNASSGDGKVAKGVGTGGGERILRCEGGPACVAKNRYNLPFELPLSWDSLMAALIAEPQTK